MPRKARSAFKKELTASIVVGVLAGSVGPFMAFIASHRLHASATLISLILAAPWVSSFLCVVWANAMEGKPRMAFTSNVWIVSRAILILMFAATTRHVFAVLAIGYQFVSMMAIPGYTAIMKAIYPDDHRGKLMGYVRTAMTVVAMVTTLIVGPILKAPGARYRFVFPIAGVIGIISALIFRSIDVPGDDKETLNGVERVSLAKSIRMSASVLRRDKRFGWFILTTTVYGFGNFLAFPWYPKFMDEVLKMDEGDLSIYCVLANIALVASYLYWGHYIDRKDPVRCTSLAILVNAGIPLVFFLSPWLHLLMPGSALYVAVLPAAILAGVYAAGLELAYFNAVLGFAPQGQEVTYQTVQAGIQGLRGIVGPLLGGILYDVFTRQHYDVRYLFLISVAMILFGWSLLVYHGRKDVLENALAGTG
ncbi:MAG: MFS transporter [Armatimonadota bacterium]|nr:MFS transporter [Armatimonadota bacterium]